MFKKASSFFIFMVLPGLLLAQKPYAAFNHVGIYVSDTRKSADFYIKLFHLDTVKTPFADQPTIWLKLGEHTQLHIIKGTKEQIVISPENHIAFSVKSIDDFMAFLNQNHIHFEGDEGKPGTVVTRADGVKQIYLKDPDGYWVEVNDAAF